MLFRPATHWRLDAKTARSRACIARHPECDQHVFYRIADPRVDALLAAAEALLVTVGEQVYVCTRYGEDPPKRPATTRQPEGASA